MEEGHEDGDRLGMEDGRSLDGENPRSHYPNHYSILESQGQSRQHSVLPSHRNRHDRGGDVGGLLLCGDQARGHEEEEALARVRRAGSRLVLRGEVGGDGEIEGEGFEGEDQWILLALVVEVVTGDPRRSP